MYLDIITAKKGGSGKTLLALIKFEEVVKKMDNVAVIDLNDMNPDFYTIIRNVFDVYLLEKGIVKPETARIDEAILKIYNVHPYKLTMDGREKRVLLVKLRQPLRFSSIDMLIALRQIIDILAEESIEYAIVDTNTSYETLVPWFLEEDTKYLDVFPTAYMLGTNLKEQLLEFLRRYMGGLLSTNIVFTTILPLSIFGSSWGLKAEMGKLAESVEFIRSRIHGDAKMYSNIVVNSYLPLGAQHRGYLRRTIEFIGNMLKKVLMRKPTIKIPKKNIWDIEDIESFIEQTMVMQDIGELNDAVANIRKNLRRAYIYLKEYERKVTRVLNFYISPIYDYDLSDVIMQLKGGELTKLIQPEKMEKKGGIIVPIIEALLEEFAEIVATTTPESDIYDYREIHIIYGYGQKFSEFLDYIMK